MVTWSALAVSTLVVGVAMASLAVAIWWRHDGPGSTAMAIAVGGNGMYALSYGVNLLVFDLRLSKLLEIPFWFAGEVMTVAFLFFALAFTGRGEFLTSRNVVSVSLIPALTVVIAATNSLGLHQAFWTDYRVVETLGAGVRVFDPAPWVYVKSTYAAVLLGAGLLLFVEETVIERTLQRSQSVAIIAGVCLPFLGYSAWLLGLGPYPAVDFTPLMFAATFGSFGYAVFVADMFETAPAVRRLGRRNTIQDLDEAIVIVTDEGIVTDLNAAATDLLGCSRAAALGEALNDLLSGDRVDLDGRTQSLSLQTPAGRRLFRVTVGRTADERGEVIGRTLLFSDVTDERRREQRLEVLNRVLRHNLRNDLNSVIAFNELIRDHSDDPKVREWADRTTDTAASLVDLGEKAREFETAIDAERTRERVVLDEVVADVLQASREGYPEAAIESAVPADAIVESDPRLVRLVVSNLVENALAHNDADHPTVTVRCEVDGETVAIVVEDDGPGIPESELATLAEGTESPLQHGQGIGLWVVQWSVTALGGTVTFEADDSGTTVTVELPAGSAEALAEATAD